MLAEPMHLPVIYEAGKVKIMVFPPLAFVQAPVTAETGSVVVEPEVLPAVVTTVEPMVICAIDGSKAMASLLQASCGTF